MVLVAVAVKEWQPTLGGGEGVVLLKIGLKLTDIDGGSWDGGGDGVEM